MKRFLLLILAVAGLFCLVSTKANAGVAVAVAPAYYGGAYYGPAYYPYPYWYGGWGWGRPYWGYWHGGWGWRGGWGGWRGGWHGGWHGRHR